MKSREVIEYDIEVERETRRLIQSGFPPWAAVKEAVKQVRVNRQLDKGKEKP